MQTNIKTKQKNAKGTGQRTENAGGETARRHTETHKKLQASKYKGNAKEISDHENENAVNVTGLQVNKRKAARKTCIATYREYVI